MTTQQLTKQYTPPMKTLTVNDNRSRLMLWKMVRGLWKQKKINPVRYQRKLRDAADHVSL